MTRLYLVRHAHSVYSPDEMRGLSVPGREEAERVADLLEDQAVSLIYSSPYTRALETVQPLAERLGLRIQVDRDLRERHLSSGPLDDFQRALEATWRDFDLVHPGGESSAAAQVRVSRAIRRIAAEARGRQAAIASHGNALALFLHTLDPLVDYEFWTRMSVPDVYEVDYAEGKSWAYRRVWPAAR